MLFILVSPLSLVGFFIAFFKLFSYNGFMKNNLNNYHKLSELLEYDLYLVSSAISNYHIDDIDKIFQNIQNLKIDIYEDEIKKCLDLPLDELIALKDAVGFRSESSYINYLVSLLELNNIFFLDFRQKDQNKKTSKYTTNSLF